MQFGGQRKRKVLRLDVGKLSQPSVLTSYQDVVARKLDSCPSESIDARWLHLRKGLYEAGLNSCGLARRVSPTWISPSSLEIIDARRLIPASSEYREARVSITRRLNESMKADRETWWSKRASEMETAYSTGNMRKLFHLIQATGKRKPCVSETICELDGTAVSDLTRRLTRWAEHFEAQFNWPIACISCLPQPVSAPCPVSVDPPTEAEIRKEIQALKRYKASGPDDLPPALFKEGGDCLLRELTLLFSQVWNLEKVPSSWGEALVVPVFKKGVRNNCSNYRGISLISVASKLMASFMLRRLSHTREQQIREEQAGFRSGRGCVDQIFTLRLLLEQRHIYRRPTFVVFLDIRAAFDSVDRTALWDCVLRNGMPEKFVRILKSLYSHTSARVRAYGHLSPSFEVSSGVRQGCPISPFLFNFAIDDILKSALEGLDGCGVDLLPGDRLCDLDYADDIALLGDDTQAAQTALDRLAVEASHFGMYFAPSKCKVLVQDWQGSVPALVLDGKHLEVVDKFVYLGSCVSAGGCMKDEIALRIAKARLTFVNLKHLWRRRDVSLALKGRVYNTTVRAVLLYGCETWSLRTEDAHRLTVFDHRCLRTIARVWWQHRITNEAVRQRIFGWSNCRSVDDIVSLCRLRWLGHVLRMPAHRLPNRVLFAVPGPEWKKPRGGQSMTWLRGMKKLTVRLSRVGDSRLPGWGPKDDDSRWLETLKDMARSRSDWRACCFHILS
jgi:hypothetical protein